MSIKIMTSVWEHFPYGGSDLLALLAMADWSSDAGLCYPSIASVAKKIRLSESQARRLIHRLRDMGYLKVTGNAKGGRKSTSYRLVIAMLPPPVEATPSTEEANENETPDLAPVQPHPSHSSDSRTIIEPSINHQTTTPSLKIIVGRASTARTLIPQGFGISQEVSEWAMKNGYDRLESHLLLFREKCRARGYRNANWDSAFKVAIIANWARLSQHHSSPAEQPRSVSTTQYEENVSDPTPTPRVCDPSSGGAIGESK